MNRKSKLFRLAGTVLIALIMAGSVAVTLMRAMGLPISWMQAYFPALVTSVICALMAYSSLGAIVAAGGFVIATGVFVVIEAPVYTAVRGLITAVIEFTNSASMDVFLGMEGTLAAVIAVVFALLFFVLLSGQGRAETGMAVILAALVVVSANVLSDTARLVDALPALIACVAAYAYTAELQQNGAVWRALVPAILAVALAFLFVPSGRITWAPLENAANRVRGIFEDYFKFTKERVAFSINEEGYDHAAEVDGELVPQLGGPARPDTKGVMRVKTDTDVLLRGSIRRTYTGVSWTDAIEKSRYLYYDFTRRSVREETFDMGRLSGLDVGSAFANIDVEVEMLSDGTSTVFVPNRLESFDFNLETATYFNSIGELFLSRRVETGDVYRLNASPVTDVDLLEPVVAQAASREDANYPDIAIMYTALPGYIEQDVYSMVQSITGGLATPYEKAIAIQNYLYGNYTYTLEVDFPPSGRDFVSYFLLDSKEGYCSYFASAMAVMGRIAGLPTRYIEGYYAVPNENGEAIVTGENAHAWVEVYFSGIGWVEFDATAGAGQGGQDDDQGSKDDGGSEDEPSGEPSQEPTVPPLEPDEPTPEPDEPTPSPDPDDNPFDEPTPSPDPDENPFDEPTPSPPPEGFDAADETDQDKSNRWLWIVLIALLILFLIALLVLWVRRRLEKANPARLCANESDPDRAAMILYRSILTLLAQLGHVPLSGETPTAFVGRITKNGLENDAFEAFVGDISMNRYAGKSVDGDVLDMGIRAYALYYGKLSRFERAKFALRRIFNGLGDFDAIP